MLYPRVIGQGSSVIIYYDREQTSCPLRGKLRYWWCIVHTIIIKLHHKPRPNLNSLI